MTLPLLGLLLLAALGLIGWGRIALGSSVAGDPTEKAAVALALGLVVLGTLLFSLGSFGWIGAAAVMPFTAVGVARASWPIPVRRPDWPVLVVGLVLAGFVGTLLAYPLTGWDPAMYRLPTALAFAQTGGLPFVPEFRFPVGPQFGEVLFAGALTVADDPLARGLVFLAFLGTVALVFAWGRRQQGWVVGLVAAALVVGSPGMALFGTDAYVDVLLTLFTFAALAVADGARDEGSGRVCWLAGSLAGAAAATRYTGLLLVVAIPLALLSTVPRSRRGRALLLATVGALGVAAPWYLRAAWLTGNPLFPLATGVFGANEWSLGSLSSLYGSESVASFLLRLTLRPGAGPPLLDPWLLVLLPLAGLGAWREPRWRLPVGFGLAFALLVWVVAPEPRFVLPALPPLALGVAAGAVNLARGRLDRRLPAVALAVALAAPGLAYVAYRLHHLGPVPRTPEAVRRFLQREVPGYSLTAWLEERGEPRRTVFAYYGERLRFYSRHRWLGDTSGPYRWTKVEPYLADPTALARVLRGFGAEVFVWVRAGQPEPEWLAAGSPELERLYGDAAGAIYRLLPADQPLASAEATSVRISGVE